MKLYPFFFLAFVPLLAAANDGDMQLQMLESRIEKLEREKAEKYAELEKCEQDTRGFKIAGTVTMLATGVGLYANIKLNEKLKKMGGGGGGRTVSGAAADTRTPEQVSSDNKDLFAELGI